MNHWPFIWAAYGLTAIGTITVVAWAYAKMRRAERRVDKL